MSLAHAAMNGSYMNGLTLPNCVNVNGLTDRVQTNGVEPAGRHVYFVGAQVDGESSTVLTIELPQDGGTR